MRYLPADHDREINDTDLVATYEDAVKIRQSMKGVKAHYPINGGDSVFIRTDAGIVEIEIAWEGSRAEKLLRFIEQQPDNLRKSSGFIIPSLDVLYLLKLSHRYKKNSPHFKKTMDDIILMRQLGARIRPEHEAFLKERETLTYTNKTPKLNQSKADFFGANTGVTYTYDHDSIHVAVKMGDRPAYLYFKPSENQVFTSRFMFEQQDHLVKLYAVLEESYVLALERSQIPYEGKITPKESFLIALEKVCTSITSGWFREFAWEHYYDVLGMYSDDYVLKFKHALAEGRIKPHAGSNYANA